LSKVLAHVKVEQTAKNLTAILAEQRVGAKRLAHLFNHQRGKNAVKTLGHGIQGVAVAGPGLGSQQGRVGTQS